MTTTTPCTLLCPPAFSAPERLASVKAALRYPGRKSLFKTPEHPCIDDDSKSFEQASDDLEFGQPARTRGFESPINRILRRRKNSPWNNERLDGPYEWDEQQTPDWNEEQFDAPPIGLAANRHRGKILRKANKPRREARIVF